jgi:formylglycine-generating enzyme required for sulfatase activity
MKCANLEVLEPITWYCFNSGDKIHPVGQKQPNDWGLFDMLGNAAEWVDNVYTGFSLELDSGETGPLTNPMGADESQDTRRPLHGLAYNNESCLVRTAWRMPLQPDYRWKNQSLRPVRTLPAK